MSLQLGSGGGGVSSGGGTGGGLGGGGGFGGGGLIALPMVLIISYSLRTGCGSVKKVEPDPPPPQSWTTIPPLQPAPDELPDLPIKSTTPLSESVAPGNWLDMNKIEGRSNIEITLKYGRTFEGEFLYLKQDHGTYIIDPIKVGLQTTLNIPLILTLNGISISNKTTITLLIDIQILNLSIFQNLDFGTSINVKFIDNNENILPNDYNIYRTQKELLKLGYYNEKPTGLLNENTITALVLFKKRYKILRSYEIYIYNFQNRSRVNFKNPDEFLQSFKVYSKECTEPVSLCVDNNFVASFTLECEGQSVEFSTEGELTITASHGKESYSIVLNKKEKEKLPDCSFTEKDKFYNNSIDFLKCYQSNNQNNLCEQSIKICFGKDIAGSFETNCQGNKINATTTGQLTITTANGRGRSVEF